jgi:dihydrofolate synthase / folylpolyglutamate synthase
MDYQQALDYLNNFTNYEKVPMPPPSANAFNLERVWRFLDLLGNPQLSYPSIVIAGTKGKGSTAILVAAALAAGGYRAGLYTQPHLHSYRERMRVNDELISRPELTGLVEEMRPAVETLLTEAEQRGAITSYEIGTALALLFFARQKVDLAVLEIGLGGRLDAVNAVKPLVSVITSLSLDHMAVLGDTIEQIAFEKGGIIKPGVPVLTVPQWPAALPVLQKIAQERGTTLRVIKPARLAGSSPTLSPARRYRTTQRVKLKYGPGKLETELPLLGEHQRLNAALAAAVLEEQQGQPGGLALSAQALKKGFAGVQWPARLQLLDHRPDQPLVVADGAHNAESAARLREALAENFYYENLWLVVGIYRDKDIAGILKELLQAPKLAGVIFSRSHSPRAASPDALIEAAQSLTQPEPLAHSEPLDQPEPLTLAHSIRIEQAPDIPAALKLAQKLAGPLDLICLTGSLSVAAEAEGSGQ